MLGLRIVETALDVRDVASALYVGIGLVRRRLRQMPVPGDLTLAERSALARLDRAGPATPGAVARMEQITPQAMGTTLAGLEAKGLIKRRADPKDRRRVIYSLTEAGSRAQRDKRSTRTEQLAKALADAFTDEELRTLEAAAPLLERLGQNI